MNKLQALRAERRLSVQEVAVGAGVNPTTISLIENGHRKAQMQTIGKLAAFFGVSVEVFGDLADKGAAARGAKGQTARQANKKTVAVDTQTLAELNRRTALVNTRQMPTLSEAESEVETAALLDALERELGLTSK